MRRIFYSVDVHGAETVWRKWISAIGIYECDVLMLCGDLAGKALVPIINYGRKGWKSGYFGMTVTLKTEDEIAEWERKLANGGVYSCRIDKDQLEKMKKDQDLVDRVMKEEVVKRMHRWLELLVEKLDTSKILSIVMPGNDDPLELDEAIKEFEDRGIMYPTDKVIDLGGHELISLEYVTPTPWDTPRETDEEGMRSMLEEKVAWLKDVPNSIWNVHCPPKDTDIDLAPQLGKDLKVKSGAEGVKMMHVGSQAVREVIEKYQPLMTLHGHIHESSGFSYIGRTLAVNPGSEYGEGLLRGFILEVTPTTVEKYWKIQG
jgi:Icc-related predicted phosphoesterase